MSPRTRRRSSTVPVTRTRSLAGSTRSVPRSRTPTRTTTARSCRSGWASWLGAGPSSRTAGRAGEEPLKQIAVNAGLEGGVVVEKVKNLPSGQGLNAATGEYVDMLKTGINDPTKVTRSALQNASSIAGLFLTTEAVIAEKPEKAAAPAAPGGGEMDF